MVRAFSLIELVVVVAVLALLAAIAIPVYQTYSIRAKIIQAVSIVKYYQQNIELYHAKNGAFPAWQQNSSIDLGANGDCFQNVNCTSGLVNPNDYIATMYLGAPPGGTLRVDLAVLFENLPELGDAAGKTLVWRGVEDNGAIRWICFRMSWDNPLFPSDLAPADCINTDLNLTAPFA